MKWAAFFQLLLKLIGLHEKKARKDEQKEAQSEHEKIENNPANWWQSNFGRLSDDASVPNDAESSNAPQGSYRENQSGRDNNTRTKGRRQDG